MLCPSIFQTFIPMSLSAPSRRLASRCLAPSTSSLPIRLHSQQRPFSQTTPKAAEGDEQKPQANPVLDEYKRRYPTESTSLQQQQQQQQMIPNSGDLGASSIFEADRRATAQAQAETEDSGDTTTKAGNVTRDPTNMNRILDPDPNARERFERKKVIQLIRRGGRLSKAEFVKRTEREHLVRSHNMKTSVKKLGMLARQIAGKGVDEAIVQMRFSKKKVAQDVLKQLQAARDEAVVVRGMGLGGVETEEHAENLNSASVDVSGTQTGEEDAVAKPSDGAVDIQLKSGKRHRVMDRSKIYIDQAWVGRGPYGKLPEYRARGRMNILYTPFTSISLLLKEEATRVREYEEREAKRTRRRLAKVWVPLPDRPIPNQRQWYSW